MGPIHQFLFFILISTNSAEICLHLLGLQSVILLPLTVVNHFPGLLRYPLSVHDIRPPLSTFNEVVYGNVTTLPARGMWWPQMLSLVYSHLTFFVSTLFTNRRRHDWIPLYSFHTSGSLK